MIEYTPSFKEWKNCCFFFKSSPEDMFIGFREREGGREREGDRHKYERETDWLPPALSLMGDQTHKLPVNGMML